MDTHRLEQFRQYFSRQKASLTEWMASAATTDTERARQAATLLTSLDTALTRMDKGDFGTCRECGGACESAAERWRLINDPTSEICLDCISETEKRRLEQELNLAKQVQMSLLPQRAPALTGSEIIFFSRPASVVTGDYYDFLQWQGRSDVGIVVGDVMGKGLPAGLMMSNLQACLKAMSMGTPPRPGELLAKVNTLVFHNIQLNKIVSLFYAHVDPVRATLSYANAGHPPAFLFRDGDPLRLGATGTLLGVHGDSAYQEKEIPLERGDLLLAYTDGLSDVPNTSGEFFADEQLIALVRKHKNKPCEELAAHVLSELEQFGPDLPLLDDLTLVFFRFGPAAHQA
jgi:sigma-B regulation protein RsbU (phosphoserine phosphatase)